MPNTKSAKRCMRTSKERNFRNRAEKSRLLTDEKQFLAKLDDKDIAGAEEELKKLFSHLDKAAKHNTIHSTKVSRKKSRLTQALNRAKA